MLSEKEIADALHAHRIVPLGVANPHGPLGLEHVAAAVEMISPARIYVDFQNADTVGRLRLNCIGTTEDLASQRVQLYDGLVLDLYSDDADAQGRPAKFLVTGVVEYAPDEQCWVAAIDWNAIRHVVVPGQPNGLGTSDVPSVLGSDVPAS